MIIVLFVNLVGVLAVLLLKLHFKKQQIRKKLSHVPTVRNEWPIIGHGHWFLLRNTKRKSEFYTIPPFRNEI